MRAYLALALVLIPGLTFARTLTFRVPRKELDASRLLEEVEEATGLLFAVHCVTCNAHGSISWLSPDNLIITVYEEPARRSDANRPYMSSIKWADGLGRIITETVKTHRKNMRSKGAQGLGSQKEAIPRSSTTTWPNGPPRHLIKEPPADHRMNDQSKPIQDIRDSKNGIPEQDKPRKTDSRRNQ
ncbi:MAG: hypothetical protein HY924_15560 [Elusimicrobia bacterium]|nr:hypothetical protein [Elusimicrobiota bacterium]